MKWLLYLGLMMFGSFITVSVLALCAAAADADRWSERQSRK